MLIFSDFIQVFVFTTHHHLKSFLVATMHHIILPKQKPKDFILRMLVFIYLNQAFHGTVRSRKCCVQ